MSLHQTIIAAVKTTIEALTGEPTVVIRDRLVVMEEDTLPLIVLVKGREIPATQYAFGGSAFRGYEVFVNLVYAQNADIQTSIDDAQGWRDTIRKTLIPDSTAVPPLLSGVTQVWRIDEIEASGVRPQAAESNYEEARLGLLYRTCEASHA